MVGGGGGGGGGGRSGCTEFYTFSCCPKAAAPCSNRTSWPTISEFNKFVLPLKLLIGFLPANLVDNVKVHYCLFDVVSYECLCISFDENKMVDVKERFFGLLLVTPLEQWGVETWV